MSRLLRAAVDGHSMLARFEHCWRVSGIWMVISIVIGSLVTGSLGAVHGMPTFRSCQMRGALLLATLMLPGWSPIRAIGDPRASSPPQ